MTMTVTKARRGHSKNELVVFGDEGKSVSICPASEMYLKTEMLQISSKYIKMELFRVPIIS